MSQIQKPTKERKWMGKKELMRYLSISKRTVENWMSMVIIRYYRVRGKVFFDQNEIDEDITQKPSSSNEKMIMVILFYT